MLKLLGLWISCLVLGMTVGLPTKVSFLHFLSFLLSYSLCASQITLIIHCMLGLCDYYIFERLVNGYNCNSNTHTHTHFIRATVIKH